MERIIKITEKQMNEIYEKGYTKEKDLLILYEDNEYFVYKLFTDWDCIDIDFKK